MGFNDRSSEGTWVWSDGSSVSYTNWHSSEPNDSGGEDCGQMNRYHPTETWNDEPCSVSFNYICE
ncbi:MAG TPA: lectin, partial [Gemmatimonadetes bacterium]|nr:lectin [Gemmatimonadota bacterium]